MRKAHTLTIVVVLLCLAVDGISQAPKNTTKPNETKKHQQSASNPPSQTIAIYDQSSSKDADKTADQHEHEIDIQRQLARFTGWLVGVGLLQFLILVVQAVLFFQQKKIMQQHKTSLEELADAAKNNAIAAKDNADAAKSSFQSVIDSERAWVVADAPKIPSEISSSQPITVFCVVGNRGKTMARVVEKGENWCIQSTLGDLPATPDYGETVKWPDGVVLSPASESVLTRTLRVPNSDAWGKVVGASMVLFVFGFVRYMDVFDRQHETRYIFRFDTNFVRKGELYVEYKSEYNRAS